MEIIATMSLPTTGVRERDAVVFTYPRIATTAGLGGAAAVRGEAATGGILSPGSWARLL